MKKTWVSTVFASAVLMIGLAGCSGGSGDSTSATNDDNGHDSEETVTIKFHTHGNEASYNWAHTIAAFEEEHPNINIDLVILSEKGDSQEAIQKLDLAAASGEQLDVLMFSDPASYAQRVHLGMVAPIDEFISEEGFAMTEEYKVDTQIDGQYYALPGKFNPWYVLMNKDHLEEAGLDVPTDWTWDDFMAYAKDLTTDDHYGTYFHGPQGDGWMEFMKLALASEENDTEFIKDDGTSNLDHPLFKKTLEMRVQMEKEDQSAVPYTDIISQKLHYRNQFFGQDASMILIGSWMNTELGGTDQFPLDFNVGVAPYPKNDLSGESYTPVTTDYMAVAANSEHKEEAYTFIRWYTTEGQVVQGKNVPSWNGVSDEDLGTIIDGILAETVAPEKVDRDSLVNVLQNAQSSKMIAPVSYQAELYKVIGEEYEKLILDDQDLDTTLEKMQERGQEIIENNQ
ncbi:sugar ABC transporter substrate-binding protein [Halalkalibacterium halodurans]|uniref:ABC transporter substrate-binding protein n=1 Tax=Halalkalibacterium halodurans TaxID=86665 RepID=UPI001068597D|nr:sugar ABC transporter substrate-binding protein [Halalkalibacterium halodurans]MED3647399.1 sugar ABC transporter substrate-binding protein [Halalkalibacterium halodurans]TES48999.1 sugar ABC transporter substrate-binding protein [Halalkalibacterium halodurans]